MGASYDDAVAELYQTPHAAFVNERKRLAGELKAAGDKAGATKLGKLPRPPISAWAVNQLWWHARDAFDAMLETAEKLRDGDLGAAAAHRDTLAKLRVRAATILGDAGHAATDATLRRVTTTLSALAPNGGFAPDAPGTLGEDRDPPGFETMGIGPAPAARDDDGKHAKRDDDGPGAKHGGGTDDGGGAKHGGKEDGEDSEGAKHEAEQRAKRDAEAEERRREAEEARQRAEAAAERRRAEQEAARKAAERHRIEAALRTAVGEVERLERDLARLRRAVDEGEGKLVKAREIVGELEAKLAELVGLTE